MKNYLKYLVFVSFTLSIEITSAQQSPDPAPTIFNEILAQLKAAPVNGMVNAFRVNRTFYGRKGSGTIGSCQFVGNELTFSTPDGGRVMDVSVYLNKNNNGVLIRTTLSTPRSAVSSIRISPDGGYFIYTMAISLEFIPYKVPCNNNPVPTVVNRIEQTNAGVSYKIYLQEPASNTNRKGIVLLGSGNNPRDPSTGDLNGGLENTTCAELAKAGYIAAVVAYRDQPALASDWSNWNSNAEMLATDMSNVANTIISKYGSAYGIGRSKVITGGVSYTSFALLSNIAISTTLADTKGLLAVCGSTEAWQAQNFKIPIFNLVCADSEQQLSGQALYNAITNMSIKAQSNGITDASCGTHCGGNTVSWAALMINQVKLWIP